ncbi:ATP-binding cassette domain-containing protein, partial [Acinetobacter baumannii]
VSMVYQQFINYPSLTVFDNIASPLRLRGAAEIHRHVRALAARLHIDHLLERHPAELSGGQQQRVALARALVFEPQLVLMDEPLGALDKQLREHMQMEIKHLHQRLGVTVVYVTHDQGEALTMSDRVAVFHQGEIQQIEPP